MLADYIFKKIHKTPEIITKLDYLNPLFTCIWPSVFQTSDQAQNDVGFYNQLIDLMYKYGKQQLEHESVYGILYRVDKMMQSESNLDQASLRRVVALC